VRRFANINGSSNAPKLAGIKKPKPLRVGFVPLTDCAPLVMAEELGLFTKHGLVVELKRELGWATIRDKIIYGELDAAQAVAGMPFAATFGIGSLACECVTGLVLSLHGNAITLSQDLWNEGVRDAKSLGDKIGSSRGQKTLTFGVVSPFSSHNFLLRQWLTGGGINPDHDVRIVVVPPPQMFSNLKAGHLDGYCVGEPWNSVAVQAQTGWCAATSARLAPGHPEKVLLVRRCFADKRASEHLALIAALYEACAYCDQRENADHIINTLALPRYLNLSSGLLGSSLRGIFDFGCGRVEGCPDFHIFRRQNANEPTQEKADWIIRLMVKSGLMPELFPGQSKVARGVFRPDAFHEAQQLAGKSPLQDQNTKTETKPIYN
jgi:ABC-type nitrate/sulfonate/bicarbonate transport system substrate-binding protein